MIILVVRFISMFLNIWGSFNLEFFFVFLFVFSVDIKWVNNLVCYLYYELVKGVYFIDVIRNIVLINLVLISWIF